LREVVCRRVVDDLLTLSKFYYPCAVTSSVTIQKAKDIDRIYEEVRDYDLVLTTDAPLSDAINGRLEHAVFGEFANTPRRIVRAEYGDPLERRDLFAKAVRETEMTWKQASYLLDLVIECWQHTGDPTDILDTRYSSPEVRRTLKIAQDEDSIYSRMEEHTVGEDLDVAVVGWHDFNELDKKVIPESYDRISIFEDESASLPEFRVFESATSLVEAIRENVTPKNANRTAIVAKQGSKKEKLIKSAFRTDGIPYTDSTTVSDSDGLRTLLKLLRTSLSSERVKVSEIRPVLRRIGVDDQIPLDRDEVYLTSLDIETVLDDFLSDVEDMTFEDAIDRYETLSGDGLDEIREVIEDVELLGEDVTEESINRLRYYVDSYDVGGDTDAGGVLFADPSASIADRPLVFYVDMDESWTVDIPDRPWIDEEDLNDRYLKSFQILLQNGNRQYYMVQQTEASEEVTPCFYLHELVDGSELRDRSIEDFTSFRNHGRYTGLAESERVSFERKELDVEVDEVDTVSQSSLNTFVKSPRAYFFDKAIDEPETRYTVRGNLLHDFAEFYANYPDFVREKGVETFVDETLSRLEPYVDILEKPILRTKFLEGAEVIVEYLDGIDILGETPEGYEKQEEENVFAELYGRPIESGSTEVRFENHGIRGNGIVDLAVDEDTLLDYKTGSKKSSSSVIKNTKVSTYEPEDADFQPILYLAHHRSTDSSDASSDSDVKRMEFRLLYMLESVGDRITDPDEYSVEDDIVTVPYVDMEFEDYVATREAFDTLCEVKKIDKSFSQMGYEPYKEFFQDHDLPDAHDKDALRDALLDDFTRYVKEYVGDYKYVRSSCKSALGNIADMRGKDILFEDEIDEFVEFVDNKITELNEYRRTEFPVGDVEVSELREKELILERRDGSSRDNGGGSR
jgi:hypothetical protein